MEYEIDIDKAEKELKNPSKPIKDDYSDLKGLAFEHGEDSPRGQQERQQYRQGLRRGIGGKNTYVPPSSRYSEHR